MHTTFVQHLARGLAVLTASIVIAGCSGPRDSTGHRSLRQTDTNFDSHEVFVAAIKTASKIVLYEGLPHQAFDHDLLREELKSKETVTLDEFPFYAETFEWKPGDAEKVTSVFQSPKSFNPFLGEKLCGGFHPDYCIEWQVGSEVYRAQICFGCHEIKVYGPELLVHCDISKQGYEQLKEILGPYQKNRPRLRD
jgi:hypothetical protein